MTTLKEAFDIVLESSAFNPVQSDQFAEGMVAEAYGEIERLRAALECIVRECSAMNKGPVAVHIAREALAEPPEQPSAETEEPAS